MINVLTFRIGFTTLIAGAAFAIAAIVASPVQAQSLENAITRALKPKAPLTRSLSVVPADNDPKAAAERQFIDRMRTRSISVEPAVAANPEERAQIAAIAKDKPAIDLEILFDYNSAAIGPKAIPALVALGNVLSKPEFSGTVFLINGHTDAAGSPEYNQGLSQRRANAVRAMLIDSYKLAPQTLIAVGFGKEQLKSPGNPMGDENRRVQIVNTNVTATAGR